MSSESKRRPKKSEAMYALNRVNAMMAVVECDAITAERSRARFGYLAFFVTGILVGIAAGVFLVASQIGALL